MKKWVIFFSFLVIIFLLSGCSRHHSQDGIGAHVVRKVEVYCEGCETIFRRSYTAPDNVRLILLCIRNLGPDFPARTDVDALTGKTLHITLKCVNGQSVTYRFRNNLYVQKKDGPWRQINPEAMGGFYQLLLSLPGDEETASGDGLPREVQTQRVFFPAFGQLGESKKR